MEITTVLLLAVMAVQTALLLWLALRKPPDQSEAVTAKLAELNGSVLAFHAALERGLTTNRTELRDELGNNRRELAASIEGLRQSTLTALNEQNEHIAASVGRVAEIEKRVAEQLAALTKANGDALAAIQKQQGDDSRAAREELARNIDALAKSLRETLDAMKLQLGEALALTKLETEKLAKDVELRLEKIRGTVEEQLQTTLEKRLGESFKLVTTQLETVQRGLGEMQQLAQGVGDLKRVLTNVKTRGTWGEVQLKNLLEEFLAPDQYDANVKVAKTSALVEFAVRLPGKDGRIDDPVWLPIDAKFPVEDYQRLVAAADAADKDALDAAVKQLASSVEKAAIDISAKYIAPPHTTDFAVMFLPTEGLYAEVARQPGLLERIQSKYKVSVSGPSTLTALLISLRMGFQTLAIEKRSSEVWQVLGAVKTEFTKFGGVLQKIEDKLQSASKEVSAAHVRTRAMERALRTAESAPESDVERLFRNVEAVGLMAGESEPEHGPLDD
jgi:DNA recombination protein RmuC